MLPRWRVQSVEVKTIGVIPLLFVSLTVVDVALGVIDPELVFPRAEVEQIDVIFRPAEYVNTIVSPGCAVKVAVAGAPAVMLNVELVASGYGWPPPAPVVSVAVSV